MTDRAGLAPASSTTAGLYIHIPFCVFLCPYCDFDKQAHDLDRLPVYVDALIADLHRQPPARLHSIYFGGGTPSLLSGEQVHRVLAACRERFDLVDDVEISLEANPNDLTAEKVAAFREAGVNRVSVGAQAFDDLALKKLGRQHTAEQAVAAVEAVRQGGVANVNVDLMFGLPDKAGTMERWERSLSVAVSLRPTHLSCYLLTLEDTTPQGRALRAGRIALPDDEAVAAMYRRCRTVLRQHGYRHYEISNWALPDHACRHNLGYWSDEPYLAVGAGACGYWNGVRYKNTPVLRQYLAAALGGAPIPLVEREELTPLERARDAALLGLRRLDGVDLASFRHRYGICLEEACADTIAMAERLGLMERADGRLRLTPSGLLVSMDLFARLHLEIAANGPTSSVRGNVA